MYDERHTKPQWSVGWTLKMIKCAMFKWCGSEKWIHSLTWIITYIYHWYKYLQAYYDNLTEGIKIIQ